MHKSFIRNKLLTLRKKKYSKNLSISSIKLFKFLKKKKVNSKIIGCYYPYNYELDILNILEIFKKKIIFLLYLKLQKIIKWTFFNGH